MVVVLILASVVIFAALRIAPGSPEYTRFHPATSQEIREAFREDLGLNDPITTQYARFVRDLLRGDMGVSLQNGKPVTELLVSHGKNTAILLVTAMVLTIALAIPLGVFAATHRDGFLDRSIMLGANLAMGIPNFVLALLLILWFAVYLRWLPPSGTAGFKALILPTIVLAAEGTAVTMRLTRASMLEQMEQDYVRTLRSGGLPGRYIVWKHALRNAATPIVSLMGIQVGVLVGYSAIVEIVFRRPGLSRLLVTSVVEQDYPVALGATLVFTAVVILGNTAANVLGAAIDPRVRTKASS